VAAIPIERRVIWIELHFARLLFGDDAHDLAVERWIRAADGPPSVGAHANRHRMPQRSAPLHRDERLVVAAVGAYRVRTELVVMSPVRCTHSSKNQPSGRPYA